MLYISTYAHCNYVLPRWLCVQQEHIMYTVLNQTKSGKNGMPRVLVTLRSGHRRKIGNYKDACNITLQVSPTATKWKTKTSPNHYTNSLQRTISTCKHSSPSCLIFVFDLPFPFFCSLLFSNKFSQFHITFSRFPSIDFLPLQ